VVEAGKPFTFNVEVSGSIKARASKCSLASVVEQAIAENKGEIEKRKATPETNKKTAADTPDQISGPSCPTLVATWEQHKCEAAEDKVLTLVKTEQLAFLSKTSVMVPCTSSSTGSSAASSGCRDLATNPHLGISSPGVCKQGEGCAIASEVGGRMNYISLYEQRAGIYKITLQASWPLDSPAASASNAGGAEAKAVIEKEVIVTVLPSWLESIPLEENAVITPLSQGAPTGAPGTNSTSIKVNEVQKIRYRLKDYFGNTIQHSSLQSSQTASNAQATGSASSSLNVDWTSAFDSWDRDVAATYTEELVNDMITIRHVSSQHPIIK
jgi:hypothetical protein